MPVQPHNAVITEDVIYRWAPGRFFAGQLAVGLIAVIGATGLFLLVDLAAGRGLSPYEGWLVTFLVPYSLIYPVGFAGLSLLFTRDCPPWLRVGAAGVELAASHTDPIFIPWSATSSARLRRWWPLTLLQITVSDSAAAIRRHRDGRRPKRRYRAGRETFIMDVGALRVESKTIRSQFTRHGCPVL